VRIRTDDEVYRVDAVWLGPPKATFPWRARYVAWGVGVVVFLLTMTVERWIGVGFGFFSTAWALVITVLITRFICSRISHERPLGAVLTMWSRELTAPREVGAGQGGAVSATRVRVNAQRPRPKVKKRGRVKEHRREVSGVRTPTQVRV
jgi:Na+/melibiose symporter-like transporter